MNSNPRIIKLLGLAIIIIGTLPLLKGVIDIILGADYPLPIVDIEFKHIPEGYLGPRDYYGSLYLYLILAEMLISISLVFTGLKVYFSKQKYYSWAQIALWSLFIYIMVSLSMWAYMALSENYNVPATGKEVGRYLVSSVFVLSWLIPVVFIPIYLITNSLRRITKLAKAL